MWLVARTVWADEHHEQLTKGKLCTIKITGIWNYILQFCSLDMTHWFVTDKIQKCKVCEIMSNMLCPEKFLHHLTHNRISRPYIIHPVHCVHHFSTRGTVNRMSVTRQYTPVSACKCRGYFEVVIKVLAMTSLFHSIISKKFVAIPNKRFIQIRSIAHSELTFASVYKRVLVWNL